MLTSLRENRPKDIDASTPKGRSSKTPINYPKPTTWRLTYGSVDRPHSILTDKHVWLEEAIASVIDPLNRNPYRAEFWEPGIDSWVPTGRYAIARAIGLIQENMPSSLWDPLARAAGVLDE